MFLEVFNLFSFFLYLVISVLVFFLGIKVINFILFCLLIIILVDFNNLCVVLLCVLMIILIGIGIFFLSVDIIIY